MGLGEGGSRIKWGGRLAWEESANGISKGLLHYIQSTLSGLKWGCLEFLQLYSWVKIQVAAWDRVTAHVTWSKGKNTSLPQGDLQLHNPMNLYTEVDPIFFPQGIIPGQCAKEYSPSYSRVWEPED